MSEYQYYEFQTIDRLLTASEQAEIRKLSSRVQLTPDYNNRSALIARFKKIKL